MPKHKIWFWLAALAAAILFDYLFGDQRAGVSFFVWISVLLAGGYLLSWREGVKPHPLSCVLTVAIIGFSAVLALRNEPFTRAISILLALAGMLLLAATFLNGHWLWYRLKDYLIEFTKVIVAGIAGAGQQLAMRKDNNPPPLDGSTAQKPSRRVWPVLRGILIALPIVIIFALLLSSADPLFADWVKKFFDTELLPEYLFRAFYILVITWILIGVYTTAIHPASKNLKPDPETPWFKPFLGWTESAIVLGAVNLLFITFVVFQVRYLFGGDANITATGYTYADYARRGFSELVIVAVLSLGLYLVLSTVTKTNAKPAKAWFSVLTVVLMGLVLVMLASSLQRLLLYENAYGFSRLRTYTHIFIYWLAALILVAIVLELINRRGRFALALLITVIGFGATLAIMNIDGFIVQRNVARAQAGSSLDVAHLNSLSTDAIPQMLKYYQDDQMPQKVHNGLGATLACFEKTTQNPAYISWQSKSLSQIRAYRLLQDNAASWSQFKPYFADRMWVIMVDGEEITCTSTFFD